MIGSFLTRTLALVLGYAYPAYECFKVVELNRPEIEQLRFWCKYWILAAVLTVFERVGDTFISWLPMYSEAKVAFFVYLWYPKTMGATYVYETFLQPYVASHETEIDRNLVELKTRAGDFVFLYWQKVANYGQTRVYEVLHYFASQAPSQQSIPQIMQRQTTQPNQQTKPASESPPASQEAAASESPPASQEAAAQQPNVAPASPSPSPSPIKRVNQQHIRHVGGRPSISEVNQNGAVATSTTTEPRPEKTQVEEPIRLTRGMLRRRAAPT